MADERREYIEGLRELAAWYEAHPEIPAPHGTAVHNAMLDSKEDAAMVIRALGSCEKHYGDSIFTIAKPFRGITLEFYFYRGSVCRQIVVGTREVPEQVIPAQPEKVIPAHTEEITKWECAPILKNEGDPEPVAQTAEQLA